MALMKCAPAAMAALILAMAPAAAQEAPALPFTSQDGALVLETMGQKLTLPPPDWVDDGSDLAVLSNEVSTRFLEESGQAHLEIYPRGEGEAFWTRLYGARVSNQAGMSLSDFRSVVINVYARSCQPEAVAVFQLEPDDGDILPPVGYVCGAYLDSFADFSGQGEVMVMGFYKSDAGLGMVYQEWRGEAFDAADPTSWPVDADVVESHMARLQTQVRLTTAD